MLFARCFYNYTSSDTTNSILLFCSLQLNIQENMNSNQPRDLEKYNKAYWNKTDCQINDLLGHTNPIICKQALEQFYIDNKINKHKLHNLQGFNRYIIENDAKPLKETMQGSVDIATDIITGRRVVIKNASKKLVNSHQRKNGQIIEEDIFQEGNILHALSQRSDADSGLN